MEKRGQLSLFIILGLIVIIAVSLVLVYRAPTTLPTGDALAVAESQITGCWEAADFTALRLVGVQGGMANPQDGLYQGVITTAYAVKDGQPAVPTDTSLEEELATMVTTLRTDCTSKLTGVTFEPANATIQVAIAPDRVTVLSSGGGTLRAGNSAKTIGDHVDSIKTLFGTLAQDAYDIAVGIAQDPEHIDINPVADAGINVTIRSFGSTSYVIVLQDMSEGYEDSVFWTAGTIGVPRDIGPVVQQPDPVTVTAGETAHGTLFVTDPLGGNLAFRSLSPFVEVSPSDGAFVVTTTSADVGDHVAPIEVTDELGRTETVLLEVRVR